MSGMAVTEKAQYLIQREYLAQMGETDKGKEAKSIRELVHVGKIPDGETYKRLNNLDQLFGINETFMNVTLRDFLNLNDDGTKIYKEPTKGQDGWGTNLGVFYHLDPRYTGIVKYENTDGRELIFGQKKDNSEKERLQPSRFSDTYNYVAGMPLYTINGMPHDRFDVQPYKRQYPGYSAEVDTLKYYLFRGKQ
jgi:hypothetical protein